MTESSAIVGPYLEPSLAQTLRNHASLLCTTPAEAEALVLRTLTAEPDTMTESPRLDLLSRLYSLWRESRTGAEPPRPRPAGSSF